MKALWLVIYFTVLIWSAINPADMPTWFLEVSPALIGIAVLWYTRRSFPLTPLTYWLILLHCVVLMIGGHYTYAHVPLGEWARELFSLERNNYDKLAHLVQGFVPAIIAREIILRREIIHSRAWCDFFAVCFCLAFSAFYEMIEWWVALLSDEAADAFLGTQGYVWDTQSDMAFALVGATLAVILLGEYHSRQMRARSYIQ
jgi:putative membrane protein